MTISDPIRYFTEQLPQILEDIRSIVETESPSSDHDALARSADEVAALGLRILGVAPERITVDGCSHLRWELGEAARSVLLLGHHDTVWPLGSLATHPYSVVDGVLKGPGTFDMKVGVVMALHAAAFVGTDAPITILITGDEEIGSPSSRALVHATADKAGAVLVLEASADGGALKTARKAMSDYEVIVEGLASHAGLEPDLGVNATLELAHQTIRVASLSDRGQGTSVVPTVVSGGTTTNTVPAHARLAVDVRAWSRQEQDRVDREMNALATLDPRAKLMVRGGRNRPPLEKESSAGLFEVAQDVATQLGLSPLTQAHVGGASDGNLTAGRGVPTLDGLGAVGGGAHADHEHALIAEIPYRTALLAGIISRLTHSV